ncbi:hypothetical protein [Tolypothrix sp. VBCCA 56010]
MVKRPRTRDRFAFKQAQNFSMPYDPFPRLYENSILMLSGDAIAIS